jgi:ligand-binding sensor domain-containing protein
MNSLKSVVLFSRSSFLIILILFCHLTINAQWIETNNGMYGGTINDLLVNGETLFAATKGGVFTSSDDGNNWISANSGLTTRTIYCLELSGTNIFAGTNKGVFLSTDNGQNWISVNSGITSPIITTLATSGGSIFAGTYFNGLFLSTNNGTSWTPVNTGLTSLHIQCITVNGGNILVGTDAGLFLSSNNGTNWTSINTNLTSTNIFALASNGSTLFAGTFGGGLFTSNDNGASWTSVNAASLDTYINFLASNGNDIYASTYKGTHLSKDNGVSWSTLTTLGTTSLVAADINVLIGTSNGVYLSSDNGTSWATVSNGLKSTKNSSLAVNGNTIFAGTYDGLFRSTDNGANWAGSNTGLTHTHIRFLTFKGSSVFAVIDNNFSGGIFRSVNNGSSWTSVNNDLINKTIYSLAVNGTTLYAGTDQGLYRSTNDGASWIFTGLNFRAIYSLTITGSKIFVGTDLGVFLSTNNGGSWNASNSGMSPTATIKSLSVNGNYFFALADNGGVSSIYVSNDGAQWTLKKSGLITGGMNNSFVISGFNVFVNTFDGVLHSNDNGESWTLINAGLINTNAQSLAVNSTTIFAGFYGAGVWSRPLSEFCKPAKPKITTSSINTLTPILTSSAGTGNQWFLNGVAMVGATNQTLVATESGTYKVQVTIGDCSSEFSEELPLIISIPDPTTEITKDAIANPCDLISAYPNPVTDWLVISLGEIRGHKEIIIYESTGKQLLSEQASDNEARFNLADYPAGLYFLKVVANGNKKMIKFSKN